MKRLINCLIMNLFVVTGIYAQQQWGNGSVAFFPALNNQQNVVPLAAISALENKMQQILTTDGYGSAVNADRFVLVAKPSVESKDITPTTPPRISQTVEITFIIGDVVENKTYGTCSLSLTGIGTNESKAWLTAISKIKPSNVDIRNMLREALDKIAAYYVDNCNSIIIKAESEAARGDFDIAIARLIEIPDICRECFEKAQLKAVEIYRQKIDAEGAAMFSKAKLEWTASPDSNGAKKAMDYLSQINPESASFAGKEVFEQEIATKLSADEQRIWVENRRRYNEELKLRQKDHQNAHQRQMTTIAACRSVAEKRAENQPQTKVYLNW